MGHLRWSLLLFALPHFPAYSFDGKVVGASLFSATGRVQANDRLLKAGDEIFVGEKVRTDAKGSAKLLLPDRSIVDLGPQTVFGVKEVKGAMGSELIDAELDLGNVRALVNKRLGQERKFFIRTKASVLAVRGTEFVVSVTSGTSAFRESVTVAQGEVEIGERGKQPYKIGGGQNFTRQAISQNGKWVTSSPVVQQASAKAVADILKGATVNDQTFSQSVTIAGTTQNAGQTSASAAIATLGKEILGSDRTPQSTHSAPPPPAVSPANDLKVNDLQQRSPEVTEGRSVNLKVKFTP